MKIRIDLTEHTQDLDENSPTGLSPSKDPNSTSLAKNVAIILKASTSGNAMKFLCWAIELHKHGFLEVDEADFKTIYDFVANHPGGPALIRGQILRKMDADLAAAHRGVAVAGITGNGRATTPVEP